MNTDNTFEIFPVNESQNMGYENLGWKTLEYVCILMDKRY